MDADFTPARILQGKDSKQRGKRLHGKLLAGGRCLGGLEGFCSQSKLLRRRLVFGHGAIEMAHVKSQPRRKMIIRGQYLVENDGGLGYFVAGSLVVSRGR